MQQGQRQTGIWNAGMQECGKRKQDFTAKWPGPTGYPQQKFHQTAWHVAGRCAGIFAKKRCHLF
jgi:hypothetical protein